MKKKKSTAILALTPVFIIIGQLLTTIIPRIGGIIRPDFSLIFLFLCIMIHPTFKQVIMASFLTVTLSMLFGSGGNILLEIPAIFDRLGAAILCLFLYRLLLKTSPKFHLVKISSLFFVSTLVSGVIYMTATYFLGSFLGLPELLILFKMGLPFLVLTVLITALANYFLGALAYKTLANVSKNKFFVQQVTAK